MFVAEIVALVYVTKRGTINYTTNTIPQWASWCCGCFVFGRTNQLNASFPSTDRSQLQLLDGNCVVFFATALFGFDWIPMFVKRQDFRYQHRIKGNCSTDCLVRIHMIMGRYTDCTITNSRLLGILLLYSMWTCPDANRGEQTTSLIATSTCALNKLATCKIYYADMRQGEGPAYAKQAYSFTYDYLRCPTALRVFKLCQ